MMAASGERCSEDIQGYGRVRDLIIVGNRFEQNDTRIAVGTYPRPQYSLLPRSIHVINNEFVGAQAQGASAFDYVAADPSGALAKELHERGNRFQP
jgi:hypothetical protein